MWNTAKHFGIEWVKQNTTKRMKKYTWTGKENLFDVSMKNTVLDEIENNENKISTHSSRWGSHLFEFSFIKDAAEQFYRS